MYNSVSIFVSLAALIIAAISYRWAKKTSLFEVRYSVYYQLRIFCINYFKYQKVIALFVNDSNDFQDEQDRLYTFIEQLEELAWKANYIFENKNIRKMIGELIDLFEGLEPLACCNHPDEKGYIALTDTINKWIHNKIHKVHKKVRTESTQFGNSHLDDLFEKDLSIYRSAIWSNIKRNFKSSFKKIN